MTAQPNPSPVLGVPPKKKSSMLNRLAIGCFGLIALACIGISAFAFYENWQQEQNYNSGHQAYLKADCASALEPLRKAARGEPGTKDSDVARNAQKDLQECEALVAVDRLAQQNKPAEAVLGYQAFLTKFPNSAIKAQTLTKGQDLVAKSKPDALADAALCQATDTLKTTSLIAKPAETMPPLLYACGQMYEKANKFSEALDAYQQFRDNYANHPLAKDVQQAFARATIAEAKATGAGALPPPQSVGRSATAGTQTLVVIQNDSPDKLSLVFTGPEARVEELAACTDCQKFTGSGPSSCPKKGPIGRYTLPPGTYEVVVKSISGRNVTPFRGSWKLDQGQEYTSCFFLVTRQ